MDIRKNNKVAIPSFVQGDTNVVEFEILDNGVAADLSTVGKVVANYKRPDKHVVTREATYAGNIVSYRMGQEEMEVAGLGEVEVQFFNADYSKRVSTFAVRINVAQSVGEAAELSDELGNTLLQDLLVKGDYAEEQAKQAEAAAKTALTNWLSPVANKAAVDAIAGPKLGDTVQTNDNGFVYRYDGTKWVKTQEYGATALANVNAQLAGKSSLTKPNSALLYSRALLEMKATPVGSLDSAKRAVSKKNLKVAIVGDSITEGADLVSREDAYANRFAEKLKKELPGVNVDFFNFALSSRRISDFTNPEFKGMETDPTDRHAGFWRTWSVLGKSWRDHIKDFAPDLLIVAFGMNDTGGTTPDEAEFNQLSALKGFVEGIASKPSMAFVTPFMPSYNHSQSQKATLSVARAIKYFAKENGHTLADVNRVYRIIRDGIDDDTRETTKEVNFEKFNTTQWAGDKSSFTLNGANLTPIVGATNKFIENTRAFYSGSIELSFLSKVEGAEGNLRIEYRRDSAYGRMTLIVVPGQANGEITLFKTSTSSTLIANKKNLTIPKDIVHKIRIEAEDNNHSVYLNGVLLFAVKSYQKLHEGSIRIGSDQTVPGLANLSIQYKDSVKGDPLYTEAEMLGVVGGSQSGNGLNHPTGQGHALFYAPTLNGIIEELKITPLTSVATPELKNGWEPVSAGMPLTVTKSGNVVNINGFIKSGTITAGTVLFTIPSESALNVRNFYPVSTTSGGGSVELSPAGDVKVGAGAWTNTWIGINIMYYLV
ncbi:SGNH/GDSL hydrolase family protein [Rossellomorea sp. FS2]|uniref:SGNH/GDSL hydrolase family protein n=1 Tax=Rossellomorea sp. FS2 TaxID=3391447 RepID=UPI003A4DF120